MISNYINDNNISNMNYAYNHFALELVKCSRVHCYYFIFNSFFFKLNEIKETNIKLAMEKLCCLFGLIQINENFGDWIIYFKEYHIEWIKNCIKKLLIDLRNDIIGLTDAFEFPDNVLNSAIGRYDGNVYESLYESAKSSELNKKDPFDGYKYLKDILDKEFLIEHKLKTSSKL